MRVDRDGYLLNLSDWSPAIARALARNEGIVLADEHWAIIELLRSFHAETGVSPSMRPLVKLVGQRLGLGKGTSMYLLRLFPGNAAKLAAKIAGLPRPTNCL
jgi:tRNA 2-thiouridine synthesizing protein E